MEQWEFTFEAAPWESVLDALRPGSRFSAARFLALMEPEAEETVEETLDALRQRDILLDIGDLPKSCGSGDTALRLRREEQLVKEGKLPEALEENDPLRLYLEELANTPVCGDPQLLAERYLAGEDVVQMLTNGMLSRVTELAFSHTGRGVLLMDLIQEGSLGLWQAILSYSGGDFEAFCDRAIRKTMASTVVLQARADGIGRKMKQAVEDYRAVDEQLLMELGRNPTLEEIAQRLHMTPEETAAVSETMEAARLLSKTKAERTPAEESPEDQMAVEDTAYFQMRQRIQELLSGLSETDARLLTMRFGLDGGVPMTPEDAGRKLGLTPEEVVEREASALEKLRKN